MKNKAFDLDLSSAKFQPTKNFFKTYTMPKILAEQPETIQRLMKEQGVTQKEAIDIFTDKTMSDLKKSLVINLKLSK